MKTIVSMACCMLIAFGSFAQTRVIEGKLTAFNRYPVQNVVVESKKAGSSVTTDSLGHFELVCNEKDVIRIKTEVFEALKFEDQSFLLNNLENAEVSEVLNEMAPDDRANLFKDLPPKVIKKFFKLMKQEEVEDVRELMTYDEGTAGAIMTTDYIELRPEMSARAAILKLQDNLSFEDDLDISSIYVTNAEHKLLGVIELQDLIKAVFRRPM